MIDWSATCRSNPRPGPDTTWVAHGSHERDAVSVVNTVTRPAAFEKAYGIVCNAVRSGRRVLVGFDFAYGYPFGTAHQLALTEHPDGAWRAVWRHLRALSDAPTIGKTDTNNGVDRFAMANELNRQYTLMQRCSNGPWWSRPDWTLSKDVLNALPNDVRNSAPFAVGTRAGHGERRRSICLDLGLRPQTYPFLDMTSPGFPLHGLARLRRTEQIAAGSQEVWKVFAPGSVGSQALSGIPYLERFHSDEHLAPYSRIWPFTTGFADPTTDANGPSVVHAEVFPSCIEVNKSLHNVKDACQVESLVRIARDRDAENSLVGAFRLPASLHGNEEAIGQVVASEGWILFSE